jgi:predicted class III extradiol MEMO1 family dioxygenase
MRHKKNVLNDAHYSTIDANRSIRKVMEKQQEKEPLTISVPTAGLRYFGIGISASYAAAHRGEIPTVKV